MIFRKWDELSYGVPHISSTRKAVDDDIDRVFEGHDEQYKKEGESLIPTEEEKQGKKRAQCIPQEGKYSLESEVLCQSGHQCGGQHACQIVTHFLSIR